MNTKAGRAYLTSLTKLAEETAEEGSVFRLNLPLRLEDRPLTDDLVQTITLERESLEAESGAMDDIVGVVALRSIPFPVVTFDNKRRTVEFTDNVQAIQIRRQFTLVSESAGGYCLPVPVDGEIWLFNLNSTGRADVTICYPLLAKLAAMKGDDEKELFRLDDTPMKPKSLTSHKSENSFRIFAMDSEVVVIDKAAMVLSLTE